MRIALINLAITILIFATASAGAQEFRFDRDDRRGDVEGKRANCEVYARIAQVQAEANTRFRCGLKGPAWVAEPQPHFRWCRYVPRRKVAEEQRNRAEELQRCFDRLGDFDDDHGGYSKSRDNHDDDRNKVRNRDRNQDRSVVCPRGYDGSSGECKRNQN